MAGPLAPCHGKRASRVVDGQLTHAKNHPEPEASEAMRSIAAAGGLLACLLSCLLHLMPPSR